MNETENTVIGIPRLQDEIIARKKSKDPVEIAKRFTLDELKAQRWQDDVQSLLQQPRFRRFMHFLLSDGCTNLLGMNANCRDAGVALMGAMDIAEPRAMEILFKHKEADENGNT